MAPPEHALDGTTLRLAEVAADGSVGEASTVAGSQHDWISQPRWSPDGVLHFAAEPSGWMNVFRFVDGRVEAVTDREAEFVYPDWLFGYVTYAFVGDGTIVAIGRSGGRDRLYRVGPEPLATARSTSVHRDEVARGRRRSRRLPLRGARPGHRDRRSRPRDVRLGPYLRQASQTPMAPEDISVPRPVEFPTTDGRTAYGQLYPPKNRSFRGPDGELPPLIVTSHGGPTAAAYTPASPRSPSCSRAAVSRPSTSTTAASTGYGKDYRKRLEGHWGWSTSTTASTGRRWLAEQGLIDGEKLAIRGGSASGYTTLCRDDVQ